MFYVISIVYKFTKFIICFQLLLCYKIIVELGVDAANWSSECNTAAFLHWS